MSSNGTTKSEPNTVKVADLLAMVEEFPAFEGVRYVVRMGDRWYHTATGDWRSPRADGTWFCTRDIAQAVADAINKRSVNRGPSDGLGYAVNGPAGGYYAKHVTNGGNDYAAEVAKSFKPAADLKARLAAADAAIDDRAMGRLAADVAACRGPVLAPLTRGELAQAADAIKAFRLALSESLFDLEQGIKSTVDRTA